MIVELFGQPGAGKTTLARAALAGSIRRSTADLGAAWKRQSIFRKGLILARAALDGDCLFHAMQLVINERLLTGDCLWRLARIFVKSHWVRSQTGEFLLEEGFIQDLWSVYYSAGRTEPDPEMLAALILCLYRGTSAKIVLLDVDPQTAFDRIRARAGGKSRLDRLPDPDLRVRLVETAQLIFRLGEAARLAGLQVVTIDGSQPIEASTSRLLANFGCGNRGAPRLG